MFNTWRISDRLYHKFIWFVLLFSILLLVILIYFFLWKYLAAVHLHVYSFFLFIIFILIQIRFQHQWNKNDKAKLCGEYDNNDIHANKKCFRPTFYSNAFTSFFHFNGSGKSPSRFPWTIVPLQYMNSEFLTFFLSKNWNLHQDRGLFLFLVVIRNMLIKNCTYDNVMKSKKILDIVNYFSFIVTEFHFKTTRSFWWQLLRLIVI